MSDRSRQIDTLNTLIDEVWNTRRLEVIEDVFMADAILHIAGGKHVGHDEIRERYIKPFLTGFPDLKIEVLDLFGEDDRYAMRMRGTGTHDGDYFGTPATGKHLDYSGIVVLRMQGDKVAEVWGHSNAALKIAEF